MRADYRNNPGTSYTTSMQFITEPNQLTIKLQGFEQLWALKRRLQIPQYAIEDVTYEPKVPTMQGLWGYWRVPGTSLPFVFMAGTYRRHESREFWYLRLRSPGVMTIFLKEGSLNYDKVRLSCTPELAQDIADWWQPHRDKRR
jgi:hypothetical protein